MPEGDTIHRAAAQMRRVLEDAHIAAATARDKRIEAEQLTGRCVQRIEAKGKHLFIHLDNEQLIHSHMGMTGSWHVYDQDSAWRKPKRNAHLVLELDNQKTCVCFTPKQLQLMTERALLRDPYMARLGPDLLDPNFDPQEALRRYRIHNQTPIGEAVMNQTLVCGIGNVYKSELLFLNGWNPFVAVANFSDDGLLALFQQARKLMRRNLDGAPRRTRFGRDGQRLWVYNRSGEKCLRCGHKIEMRRQGDLGRSTYWCRSCQHDNNTSESPAPKH